MDRLGAGRPVNLTRDQGEGNVSSCQLSKGLRFTNPQSRLHIFIPHVCRTHQNSFLGKLMNSYRCYLITHAHLDHTLSLIMLSGSVPPRPPIAAYAQPPITPISDQGVDEPKHGRERNAPQARVPVFGTKETLERLSLAYGGGLWPELGQWAPDSQHSAGRVGTRKRRKVQKEPHAKTDGCGVVLSP